MPVRPHNLQILFNSQITLQIKIWAFCRNVVGMPAFYFEGVVGVLPHVPRAIERVDRHYFSDA